MRQSSLQKRADLKRAVSPIVLIIDEPLWRADARVSRLIRRAVRLAFVTPARSAERNSDVSVTILLTDDRRLRALNKNFRGKNYATNVLSFPASPAHQVPASYLGDIALGYGVIKKEAKTQKKDFAEHAAHLAVHGFLHLLGYDHETEHDAAIMEELEIRLLARLRIDNPYLFAARSKAGKEA